MTDTSSRTKRSEDPGSVSERSADYLSPPVEVERSEGEEVRLRFILFTIPDPLRRPG
jgi:hypothetical protein